MPPITIPGAFWAGVAIFLASIVGILSGSWLLTRMSRILPPARRKLLREEFRRAELVKKLKAIERLERTWPLKSWTLLLQPETAKARRLSKIPREVRVLFEELESLLDYFQGSPETNIEAEREFKVVYCKALIRNAAMALELDNPTVAIKRIKRALRFGEEFIARIGEDLSYVYFMLGTAYMWWGSAELSEDELESAARSLEKSMTIGTTTDAQFNLAWTYDELARIRKDRTLFEKAVEGLRAIIEREPQRTAARYNLACALTLLGRYDEALRELEQIPEGHELWSLSETDPDLTPLRTSDATRGRFEDLLSMKLQPVETTLGP